MLNSHVHCDDLQDLVNMVVAKLYNIESKPVVLMIDDRSSDRRHG